MKRPLYVVVAEGMMGGVLAGVVVAAWFFVTDALQGQPFRTPAVLAQLFFARESVEISVQLVTFYTVLHLGAFAGLGVVTAWTLAALETPPTLIAGALFGVLVLEIAFYGVLLSTGARIFGVLPWPHVLASNVVGGMTLMTYLHRAGRNERPFGLAVLKAHPLLGQGLVTGLLGAAAVALWFLGLDVAAGRPLRTPAALGSVLFLGAESPAEVQTGLGVVAAYTALHVAVFAAIGTALVVLARGVQRAPQLLPIIGLASIVLEALVVPAMGLTAEWGLGALGVWSVAVGNVLATGAMGLWIWRTHPGLRDTLRRPVDVWT